MLVVQSALESPVISRSVEGFIWRQKFVVPRRYLSILFIPCQWSIVGELIYWLSFWQYVMFGWVLVRYC